MTIKTNPPFQFKNLALLTLCFKARQQIQQLPHYHGALWNALFRDLIRDFVEPLVPLSETEFRVHPVDTGILYYEKGDAVNVGVSFPIGLLEAVFKMLSEFNALGSGRGQINPGTLELIEVVCRISQFRFDMNQAHTGNLEMVHPVTEAMICLDADNLIRLKKFSMIFFAPLRLKSPGEYRKATGHTHIGPDFFNACPGASAHFMEVASADSTEFDLKTTQTNLTWYDLTYGRHATTMGGITGRVQLTGTLTKEAARCIVAAQYTGLGKNRSFGFGFFQIPELMPESLVSPLERGITIRERVFSVKALESALEKLPNSSPGPDGLTLGDIKKADRPFLENLSLALMQNKHVQGPQKIYRQKKQAGGFREIHIFNITDRIIHRAMADFLSPVAETLLSDACFSYRKKRNRQKAVMAVISGFKKGFTTGVKTDINAFFDSVVPHTLSSILEGIFPFNGFHELINNIVFETREAGIQGIAQGSPLSPVLSNLYLDGFDRQMTQQGYRVIRYGDDLVVLSRKNDANAIPDIMEKALAPLGLSLNLKKTQFLDTATEFTFLGFSITGNQVIEKKNKPEQKIQDSWLPVFREEVIKGYPVYLTTLCRGAYSNGPYLVIQDDQNVSSQISWSMISRIVVVGRSSFSSGVVYRAVKESIPVSFIDILGRSSGHLTSAEAEIPSNGNLQEIRLSDQKFALTLARGIISAKIHNTHVLLRRNQSPIPSLKKMAAKAAKAENLEQLRGFEGNAARIYFQALQTLVKPFDFQKRVFHPPDSPVNAMLSFGYTLLYNRVATALRDNGLNPYIGFLHSQGGRHFALASDLMEELRHVVERVMLALIHLKEITPDDFESCQRNSKPFCRIKGDAFRKFIRRYEAAMATTFQYTKTEKISYNAYIDEMAANLVRSMKLDIPFSSLRIR